MPERDDVPKLFAHITFSHSGKTQVPQWHIPWISHHTHTVLHIGETHTYAQKKTFITLISPIHRTFYRWHHFCHVYALCTCVQGGGGLQREPGLNWSSWAVIHSHTLPLHPLFVSANFSLEYPSALGILGCTMLITGRCRGFYNTAVSFYITELKFLSQCVINFRQLIFWALYIGY